VNNKSISIKVEPEKSKVTFSANSAEGNNSESVINLSNYEGSSDSWEQAFNADYLIDYFNTIKTDNLLWESNPGKPSVISPEHEKEKQLYLVSGLK
jgi:DNA polymerase III sliding clamp (beta) subunit (PCNA family)